MRSFKNRKALFNTTFQQDLEIFNMKLQYKVLNTQTFIQLLLRSELIAMRSFGLLAFWCLSFSVYSHNVSFSDINELPKVQIIHLSNDVSLASIDIYVNGDKWFEDVLLEHATQFLEYLPQSHSFAFAPSSSSSVAEAIYSTTQTLEENKVYTFILFGELNSATSPLQVYIDASALSSVSDPNQTAVGFTHFAQGQDPINMVLRDGPMIVSALSFSNFSPAIILSSDEHYLDAKYDNGVANLIGTYRLSLQSFGGSALRVIGLPSNIPNSPMRFIAVQVDGLVLPLDLSPLGRVQYANALDITVDIFKNGTRFSENAASGGAMPYKNIPADILISIGISPFDNINVNTPLEPYGISEFTFENMKVYSAVSAGKIGAAEFPPSMFIEEGSKERAADTSTVEIKWFNGMYLHTPLDISINGASAVNGLSYSDFSDYVVVAENQADIVVRRQQDGAEIISGCVFDLSASKGATLLYFLLYNSEGRPELWAAMKDGSSQKVCDAVSVQGPAGHTLGLSITPNPACSYVRVSGQLQSATPLYYDLVSAFFGGDSVNLNRLIILQKSLLKTLPSPVAMDYGMRKEIRKLKNLNLE